MTTPKRLHFYSLQEAASQSAPLAGLMASVDQSKQLLALVQPALPAHLRPHVRAGMLMGHEWTLLTPNAACTAKLKQLLPTLTNLLDAQGHHAMKLSVKQLQNSGG